MSFYVSIDAGLVKVDLYIARLALVPRQRKDSNISLILKKYCCTHLAVSSKSEAKLFNLLSFKPSFTPWANKARHVKALDEIGVLTL